MHRMERMLLGWIFFGLQKTMPIHTIFINGFGRTLHRLNIAAIGVNICRQPIARKAQRICKAGILSLKNLKRYANKWIQEILF